MSRNKRKIELKIIIPIIIFMLISAGMLYFLVSLYAKSIFEDEMVSKLQHFQSEFYKEIERSSFEALLVAEIFAEKRTEENYELNDTAARSGLLRLYQDKLAVHQRVVGEDVPYRIHFLRTPARSLLKTWIPDELVSVGEDLSDFRQSLLEVSRSGLAVKGIEIGRNGAALRGIVPVFSDNRIIGMVEAFVPISHACKALSADDMKVYAFTKTDESKIFTADRRTIGDFLPENDTENIPEFIDADFIEAGLSGFNYKQVDTLAVASFPLKSFDDRVVGAVIISLSLPEQVQSQKALMGIVGILEIAWLVLVFIFSYFLIRLLVSKPIVAMTKVTENLRDGDLRVLYTNKSKDEIGFLAQSLNKAFMKIRDDLASLKSSAENVYYAGDQLNHTSQSVSQGSSEQAASVQEVSASMEEMSANIEQNNNNAQITEKEIFLASASVYEGSKSVKKTADLMKSIDERIQIVDQIAKQTNILALNASVEAANAGEAGEGFSVIAREIRELAEKSRRAAIDIQEATETGVSISEKSNKELTDIVRKMEAAVEMVKQITTAGKEQKHGVEQVNGGVEQLNKVTQQNAAVAEEMATNAEELVSQSEMLKNIVASYKISDQAQALADADLNLEEFKESQTFERVDDDFDDDSFESFADKKEDKSTNGNLIERKSDNQGYTYDLDDNGVSDDDFEKF